MKEETIGGMATKTTKGAALGKDEIVAALNEDTVRVNHLDLVGAAEAALEILGVERARINKWRRKDILLGDGTRIKFPEPITMATTSARLNKCGNCGTVYEYAEPQPKVRPRRKCPTCKKSDLHAAVIPDHSKLAATPLWWASDIWALKRLLEEKKTRD